MNRRRWLPTLALLALLMPALSAVEGTSGASAQPPDALPPAGGGGLAPREIQQMIDAYVVMQAQGALDLSDEQFPQFVTRLRPLQEARRRHQQGRNRLIQELNRLTPPRGGAADDALIKERLKALQDHETRSLGEIQKALEGLDQILTLRQQARLRVFEEQMERRKIDLLVRARQGARGMPPRVPKRPGGL